MGPPAEDVSRIEQWGPVCRGFTVSLPNGTSGHVTDIRLREGGVELLIESPSSPPRTVAGAEIEAILPPTRRIIICGSVPAETDAAGVDAVGGIIRIPARHSLRLAASPEGVA